ncbi:branched-chain amino acid ABC transporter permease [Rhodoferax sp.]|uniref:branched-chain amino acid ABC transporter permease n=1 Tax=Rhodoferax sp. TaxID=50421 RepID=UPI002852A33E|nr:branched-chain amino acid ABC transporter permease [Rhodoferax sp.]
MKQRLSILLLLVIVLAVLPGILSLLGGGYWFRVVTTIGIFAILTMSANLITGTTGLMTLGHAGFYGIGAYTAALLATQMHWPFYLTLPTAGGLTALIGILLALPTMRLMGIYFAVATLGLGEIIHVSLLNWVDFTRGPMGISAIPGMALPGVFGASDLTHYYAVATVVVVTVVVLGRLTHSYFGNALRAVREDDQCAAAMGLGVVKIKIQAFAISCFFAGVAGALWAHTTGYISPGDFRFSESILILAMIVVGGLGSLPGAILGATILLGLPEVLRPIGDYRMIVVGVVMFLSILFLPRGLLGETAVLAVVRRQFGLAWNKTLNLGWHQ